MQALKRLEEADAIARLRERDTSLFAQDIDSRIPIGQRLGWTDLASKARGRFPLLSNLASALASEGARDVLLLGMGGSSLAALVLARVCGSAPGMPALHVLDTTSPVAVQRVLHTLQQEHTFVIVASKSGTTIEPLSLYAIVRAWLEERLPRPQAGRHCIVITDPGSPLEKLRQRELMRVTLSSPASVGGRFSALTLFGLAPAALIGIDVEQLVARAITMENACGKVSEQNPAAVLAAWITDAYEAGRDKLTLVTSPGLAAFGLWVEQLVAESLGKDGIGIVPVIEYEPTQPTGYGPDRAVVVLRLDSDEHLATWSRTTAAEHPVFELALADALDIGAEFVRWEYAIALVGFLLGVNPFDEPNVAEAKKATADILAGARAVPAAVADLGGTWVTYAGALSVPSPLPQTRSEALAGWLRSARPGDYCAILAFMPEDDTFLAPLTRAAKTLSSAKGIATTLELGPRYLHSTGQLHKGGPDTGVFMLVTARDRTDIPISGEKYTLAALHRAQAEGDLVTLAAHGRRVMRVDLPSLSAANVASLAEDIRSAAG
ncbi:MAG: glucose-6-phosphate isomerase [Actinomycetia bacterium]|nr:glucose-6-phosphate isomerase [Actinomycetes bacterium]